MAKHYLYVNQGYITRWQYDPANEATHDFGLFTDRFYNCIIIVLRSNTNNKIVMIHADGWINLADVKEQIEWAGKDCSKVIYYKENDDANITIDTLFKSDPIKKEFSQILIKKRIENGKIINDPNKIFHPKSGVMIPDFEAAIIYADRYGSQSQDVSLQCNHIKADAQLRSIYKNWQKPEFGAYANKPGSKISKKTLITEQHEMIGIVSQELLTKYHLSYATQTNLEQGLRLAAKNGNEQDLKNFMQYVTDINAPDPISGDTALHLAAMHHHNSCSQLLSAHKTVNLMLTNKAGKTILDLFLTPEKDLISEQDQVPQKLLTNYGLPNSEPINIEKGLRASAFNGKTEDLKIFMKYVKNINAQGPTSGNTALHFAIIGKHEACVKLLSKDPRINPTLENNKQKTVADLLKDQENAKKNPEENTEETTNISSFGFK